MLWGLARVAFDSPRWRPAIARGWYQMLAAKAKQERWSFINYGFAPEDGSRLVLLPGDEPDRCSIELYARVVSPVNMAGARVLEVGSGRGGGASYLARYHHPAHVIGVDFAPAATDLCRRQHAAVANLEFAVGDAEQLPFPDASFDAVVNVESSHCYGDVDAFAAQVVRVLRPGGHFLFADFRAREEMPVLAALLDARSEWTCVDREDLTAGVVASLEASDAAKRQWIAARVLGAFRGVVREFAGVAGSRMHRMLKARDFVYHRLAYRRNRAL